MPVAVAGLVAGLGFEVAAVIGLTVGWAGALAVGSTRLAALVTVLEREAGE